MAAVVRSLLCLLLLAVLCVENCRCLKPVRIGNLVARSEAHSGLVGGLVFFLNQETLYVRDFFFQISDGSTGYFCIQLPGDTNYIVLNENDQLNAGYSSSDLELGLPEGQTVAVIVSVGVCGDTGGTVVLASVGVVPQVVVNVPCETTFLGELPSGSNGIQGRVYLMDRETFAVIGFSYDGMDITGMEPDAFFWAGGGEPSIQGYPCSYGSNIISSIPAIEDQDVVVSVPNVAIGSKINYLAIWCRTVSVNLGHVSFDQDLIPTVGPPVVNTDPVEIGSFQTRGHSVRGDISALNERTLFIKGFNYDGTAPVVYFWAVQGSSVRDDTYWILPDETGSFEPIRGYSNEDITIVIPESLAITIHDIDWISIWCERFSVNFGEVQVPDNLPLGDDAVIIPTLPPIEPCVKLEPQVPINCKQLSDDVTVSWILDGDSITITLCGCVLPNSYIAFGLSGDPNRVKMVGADAVWTWLDNEGIHAEDLYPTAYSQCLFVDGTNVTNGACPDQATNSVKGYSGFREDCTTCITYTRPLAAESPVEDMAITPGVEQYIVWAMGPVGSIVTPKGTTIPIPFKHFVRAGEVGTDVLKLDFGREPVDECSLSCVDCVEEVVPWKQPILPHNTTIVARIGQSGNLKGYFGITGNSGWGITWYLNGLLIPEIRFRRGVTYTFITEGGEDSSVLARYHPFYLTDSDRGGYLVKSMADQLEETIYAGFEGETPIGVGRYCEYQNQGTDRSLEFDTFEEYKTTLRLECDPGTPGMFRWTPDESTPDVIYYQCATHQFLGYKAYVEGGAAAHGTSLIWSMAAMALASLALHLI